jgi:hypothetical protein
MDEELYSTLAMSELFFGSDSQRDNSRWLIF